MIPTVAVSPLLSESASKSANRGKCEIVWKAQRSSFKTLWWVSSNVHAGKDSSYLDLPVPLPVICTVLTLHSFNITSMVSQSAHGRGPLSIPIQTRCSTWLRILNTQNHFVKRLLPSRRMTATSRRLRLRIDNFPKGSMRLNTILECKWPYSSLFSKLWIWTAKMSCIFLRRWRNKGSSLI